MFRIDDPSAAVALPTPEAALTEAYITEGVPGVTAPTLVRASWLNMIQEELRAIVIAGGLTPSKTTYTQVRDAIQQMINYGQAKTPVRAVTVGANITLAGGAPNTLDGVTLAANDRILVKDQTTGSQNGIYVVTTLGTGANGTWTRATDADGVGEMVAGMMVVSSEGTTNADALWELTTDGVITIGTTSLVFVRNFNARIRLAANITLYVATTGSDTANNGLSVGSPFLTVQKAINTLQSGYDLNGFVATIQVADGTYAPASGTPIASVLGAFVGATGPASVLLQGNTGTPGNVIFSTTNANVIHAYYGGQLRVTGCKMQTTTAGSAVYSYAFGSYVQFGNVQFGTCVGPHVYAIEGNAEAYSNYTINGVAPAHWEAQQGGLVRCVGLTITLTGTPAFSSWFAVADQAGNVSVPSNTFSGAATGARYSVTLNGIMYTSGGGATYLPGSVAGSVATQGQYV